ncbi:MAG: DNA helicase UvrD [Deltaproteobacteria bacterium]|nr:DNA helicase UvrD [Deltaproteobacteria bacterium]
MTRIVSDILRSPPANLRSIPHVAVIELEAAILRANIISYLMQPDLNNKHFHKFIDLLLNYYQGKGGDTPTKKDIATATTLQKSHKKHLTTLTNGKAERKNSILFKIRETYNHARTLKLIGVTDKDWQAIQHQLENSSYSHSQLRDVAKESRNIRLFERGTQLRQALSQNWRDDGAYTKALEIIKQAFVREHFATNKKVEVGVLIMNMHKAKGKQFDEVIIFEGWPIIVKGKIVANFDRIVLGNSSNQINDYTSYNLRVSITRGKQHTTILTPNNDPCVLLQNWDGIK